MDLSTLSDRQFSYVLVIVGALIGVVTTSILPVFLGLIIGAGLAFAAGVALVKYRDSQMITPPADH